MPEVIFASDILLVSVAFAWLAAACVADIKKREIPNWISFSLLAIALAIRGAASIMTKQSSYFLFALLAIVIFLIVANILYYGKLIGGGDAKLLIALSAIFATAPFFTKASLLQEPFLLAFFINILLLGFVYSVVFSAIMAIRNRKPFSIEFRKEQKRTKIFKICCWIISFIVFILIVMSLLFDMLFLPFLILIFIVFFAMPFLYSFIKAVESSSMIKLLKPSELSEGDLLVAGVKLKNIIIKPCVHGLSESDIKAIRKANKKVLIRQGLPFVPVFLIALICTLLFSDLLMQIILAFI